MSDLRRKSQFSDGEGDATTKSVLGIGKDGSTWKDRTNLLSVPCELHYGHQKREAPTRKELEP